MAGIYLSATVVGAASVILGEAITRAAGHRPWRGWAPAVGLAALLGVASLAIRMPGNDAASAVVLALLLMGCAAWLGRGRAPPLRLDLLAGGAVVVAWSFVPFIANARFGMLGVGVNNDLAIHLSWTLSLIGDPHALEPLPGYPLGPHSVAATVSALTGADLDQAFTGLLVAVPLLTVPTALAGLAELPIERRVIAAVLVATAYLSAAYYVQSAFKETALGLLLLGFAVALRDLARTHALRARMAIPLGVLCAGTVYDFGYPGLAWPLAAAAIWLGLELVGRGPPLSPRALLARGRSSLSRSSNIGGSALAAGAVLVLLLLPESSRILDLFQRFGTSPADTGVIPTADVGNLAPLLVPQPIPMQEVLGLWPSDDWRFPPSAFHKGELTVLGGLAAVFGVAWWIRRRDFVLPGTVAGALLLYLAIRSGESPYLAAKALAIAAPVVMLLLARPLLGRPPCQKVLEARAVQAVIALAFVAVAVWSSFLALRSAQVGPRSHAEELAELRPLLKGGRTLFLGTDSFAAWHLRGIPLSMPAGAAGGTRQVSTRIEKRWSLGNPVDFDSVPARELDGVAYVVTSRTHYASEPPPNFRLVRSTRSYQLWSRLGRTPRRLILNEGNAPGAVLDCRTEAGRLLSQRAGWARVWPLPVRVPVPEGHTGVGLGAEKSLRLDLGPGEWELSLQYTSPQRLTVAGSGIRGSLPASRDWQGPFWEIGEVTDEGGEPTSLTFRVMNPTHFRPRQQVALLYDVAAVRIDAKPRLLPLSRACGRYVDWFTLGPRRPAA